MQAGTVAAAGPVADHSQVAEAVSLLADRFHDVDQDTPHAYASFLADRDDEQGRARLRQEGVATIRAFLHGMR